MMEEKECGSQTENHSKLKRCGAVMDMVRLENLICWGSKMVRQMVDHLERVHRVG